MMQVSVFQGKPPEDRELFAVARVTFDPWPFEDDSVYTEGWWYWYWSELGGGERMCAPSSPWFLNGIDNEVFIMNNGDHIIAPHKDADKFLATYGW